MSIEMEQRMPPMPPQGAYADFKVKNKQILPVDYPL